MSDDWKIIGSLVFGVLGALMIAPRLAEFLRKHRVFMKEEAEEVEDEGDAEDDGSEEVF